MLKKRLRAICVILLVFLSGCNIYNFLYSEFTLKIINETSSDITEIKITQGSDTEILYTGIIAPSQMYRTTFDKRDRYSVSGTLSDNSTFSESVNFSNREEAILRVVE